MRRLLLLVGMVLLLAGCSRGPKVAMPTDTIPAPTMPPMEMKSGNLIPTSPNQGGQ